VSQGVPVLCPDGFDIFTAAEFDDFEGIEVIFRKDVLA
jgi:hypothetical protein